MASLPLRPARRSGAPTGRTLFTISGIAATAGLLIGSFVGHDAPRGPSTAGASSSAVTLASTTRARLDRIDRLDGVDGRPASTSAVAPSTTPATTASPAATSVAPSTTAAPASATSAPAETQGVDDSPTAGVVDIESSLTARAGKKFGTGIIIDASGLVMTNAHVVYGVTRIVVGVLALQQTFDATVVGSDAAGDIAVLQLIDAPPLPVATFGSSSSLQAGDQVTAVGNAVAGSPLGSRIADGSILAVGGHVTEAEENGHGLTTLTDVIEVATTFTAGLSGGPLRDGAGAVVGVDTARDTSHRGRSRIGYAIPIERALADARDLVARSTH